MWRIQGGIQRLGGPGGMESHKEAEVVRASLIPRPSSLVGKNKGEEGLVKLIT